MPITNGIRNSYIKQVLRSENCLAGYTLNTCLSGITILLTFCDFVHQWEKVQTFILHFALAVADKSVK